MLRRFTASLIFLLLALVTAGCTNKKVKNPIAQVDSKQPDKVLFDRAMDAMKHDKYDMARLSLQTLINTYPDSEYIARAKLAVGDSWYAEGGSAAMAQAESEYRDFITFFPNMPEAAEAQLKIAYIHYRDMEKPDRDFTHALRAEEEYRTLIQQWPDSKLVPEAKQRLREVQEVLAEREFRVARFYYLRESWAASIARLHSLVDSYPLYSQVDEALFMLGNAYEHQAAGVRLTNMSEALKGQMIKAINDRAAAAYDKILTRYPAMERADDAKKRLQALNRPVPTPTAEAIAQNKAEEASREAPGMVSRFMGNLHKRPDTAPAAKVGEPPLEDAKITTATDVIRETNESLLRAVASVNAGANGTAPPPNGAPPRSDNPASAQPTNAAAAGSGDSNPPAQPSESAPEPGDPSIGVLTPNVAPAANSTAGATNSSAVEVLGSQPPPPPAAVAPPPAPAQVNEVQPSQSSSASQTSTDAQPDAAKTDAAKANDQAAPNDKKNSSTSQKKKGLKKLVPF